MKKKNFNLPKDNYSDEWITPQWLIDAVGISDLDPCASKPVIVQTARKIYTIEDNGFNKKWKGSVWLNPPFSELYEWLYKLAVHGNGIALIPARTETKGFQTWASSAKAINMVAGRITFLHKDGTPASGGINAPMLLLAFGSRNVERIQQVKGIICGNLYNVYP